MISWISRCLSWASRIGIGEAALAPVFMHDDVAVAWSEFRMELSAPGSSGETLGLVHANLGWVHTLPPFKVAFSPAMMRNDDHLDVRRADRRN